MPDYLKTVLADRSPGDCNFLGLTRGNRQIGKRFLVDNPALGPSIYEIRGGGGGAAWWPEEAGDQALQEQKPQVLVRR